MQATPNSSTIKLTTTSTTIAPTAITTGTNQHNLSTTGGNIKITKSTKTSFSKKTTLTTLNTDSSASKEIEEISKKISEHADAIYRTWKCRGLAPTEILDIYTNAAAAAVEQHVTSEAAADIFGGSVGAAAAVGSTEGLQKLVSQFVIKDKEQRGVKTSTYGSVSGIGVNKSQRTESASTPNATASTAVTTATTTKSMPENIGNKMTQKTGGSNVGISVAGTLKQTASKTTGIQKPTTTSTTSAILLKSSNSNENSSVRKLAKSPGIATASTKTASSTTTTTISPSTSLSSTSSASIGATSTKNNACVKNVNSAQQQRNNNSIGGNKPTIQATTSTSVTTTTTTTPTTTMTTTKRILGKGNTAPSLDINLNLDLGFDALQLDVNSLSQLQTQNLLKINEFLQENATQEPKKATITKATTKIKRAKSPAKLLEPSTETDSPIVTKTKSTKVLNESEQATSNNNVKKITKTLNNTNNNNSSNNNKNISNSISDKSNSSILLSNSNDCVGGEINDAAISQLISANDNTSRLTSGKTTKTTTPTIKTKSNTTTRSTIAKTTTTTTINDATATPTASAAIANVSSVKTVDHQSSIKALDSKSGSANSVSVSITNDSGAKKQPQALNDNVAQQVTPQKSTTTATVFKKLTAKECKINESEFKTNNISGSSNINNNNNNSSITSVSTFKSHKSVKSSNSKATTVATVAAASTTAKRGMEIASESNNKINNNNNSNGNSNSNGNNNSNSSSEMPAPTKLNSGRAALGATQDKLNRPFLTRGSVAERVLMFEKRPGVRNSYLNIKRPDLDVLPRSLSKVSFKLHSTPPGNNQQTEQNSLQKEIRSTRSVYIPRFYFPHGKPQPQIAQERMLRGILSAFDSFPNNQVTKDELPQILKICGLPFYWRMPVVVFCQQNNNGLVERQRFLEFWKQMNIYCHDAASRFVYIHSRGQRFRSHIAPEDLVPLVQDVVDTHPGLAFLKEASEFHSRYVHTVIARIFYSVNRCWSGKITISELKKSDLLEIITLLEEEDDINQIMAFFSYEHFYVIYCKFWELDKDHDLLINQDDLARHSDHALSTRIVERIFSGCVTRSDNKKSPDDEPKMSYTDFVWFLLSEEDKRTPTAIEYWFRCMDLDGDGLLSMYELEYFYEEQQQRMESIGIETLPFEDCLCQMLDMIKPQQHDAISLGDLKRCRMTHVFFDTFFNLEKYLDHEQRDPFATQRDEYSSDWDRFAAHEYELLISEENG